MGDVGVLGVDQQLSFEAELVAHAEIGVGDFFDGALVAEGEVGGAIHAGVAATADDLVEAITLGEHCAGG